MMGKNDPTTKVIIAAGGRGKRWNNYLGVSKHNIIIDGEPIIERTKRLLKKYDLEAEVISKGRQRYGDLAKIYSSRFSWNKGGRTIILFGDVYFTDEAMLKIHDCQNLEFTCFGRIEPSQITGKGYGELFAVSFYPEHIPDIITAIKRVYALHERGVVKSANLWALYRAYHHFPDDLMDDHYAGKNIEVINDWTEDFDFPHDLDNWLDRRKK